MEQSSSGQPGPPVFDSKTALLAVLPVAAYLYSYQYERSYCAFFHIPAELITVSLDSLLSPGIVAASVVSFALLVLLVRIQYSTLRNDLPARFGRSAPAVTALIVSFAVFAVSGAGLQMYPLFLAAAWILSFVAVKADVSEFEYRASSVRLATSLIAVLLFTEGLIVVPAGIGMVMFVRSHEAEVRQSFAQSHPSRTSPRAADQVYLRFAIDYYASHRPSTDEQLSNKFEKLYYVVQPYQILVIAYVLAVIIMQLRIVRIVPGLIVSLWPKRVASQTIVLDRLIVAIGPTGYAAALGLFLLLGISGELGYFKASTQTEFPVMRVDNTSYALLRKYGDNLITAKVVGAQLTDTFHIFRLGKDAGTDFQTEPIRGTVFHAGPAATTSPHLNTTQRP